MKSIYTSPAVRIIDLDAEQLLASSVNTGLKINNQNATVGNTGDDALTQKDNLWESDNIWAE